MALTAADIDARIKADREEADAKAKEAKAKLTDAAKLSKEADDRESKIKSEQTAIAELRDNPARLEDEVERLINPAAPRRTRRASGSGRRRSGGSFNEDAVLSYIKRAGEPVGAGVLKDVAGDVSGATLSNNLKRLVDAGTLKKTGEKTGTKYTAA